MCSVRLCVHICVCVWSVLACARVWSVFACARVCAVRVRVWVCMSCCHCAAAAPACTQITVGTLSLALKIDPACHACQMSPATHHLLHAKQACLASPS